MPISRFLFQLDASEHDVAATIDELRERCLLLLIDRRLITLAVQGDLPKLPDRHAFPGGCIDETQLDAPALQVATLGGS